VLINVPLNYQFGCFTPIFRKIESVVTETNNLPSRHFFNHLRILVVDNYPDICELFSLVLEEVGAKVTTANTCENALTHIKANPPDVIISEIFLPNENGLTLIRKARELADKTNHPLLAIAVTSYTEEREQLEICSAGFQKCLSKPVDVYELVEAVVDLVEKQNNGS
jgi:CheY-like chemotaxis protein